MRFASGAALPSKVPAPPSPASSSNDDLLFVKGLLLGNSVAAVIEAGALESAVGTWTFR